MNIEGKDASYAETLARVAALLDAEKVDHQRIANMSQESAREYLNEAIIKISQALGLVAAKTAAMVADLVEMARNAGKAFTGTYRDSYQKARRIRPYEG